MLFLSAIKSDDNDQSAFCFSYSKILRPTVNHKFCYWTNWFDSGRAQETINISGLPIWFFNLLKTIKNKLNFCDL